MASGLRNKTAKTDASIDSLYSAAASYNANSCNVSDLSGPGLARPTTPSTLLQRKAGRTGTGNDTRGNIRGPQAAPRDMGDSLRSSPTSGSSSSTRPALPTASRSGAICAASPPASARPALPTSARGVGPCGPTASAPASARTALRRARSVAGAKTSPPFASATAKPNNSDANPEFRTVTVEISGRSGYNTAAINGVWNFWRIIGGRLAFSRDAEVQVEHSAVVGEGNDELVEDDEEEVKAKVRLYLFYVPRIDMWLISDAPDMSGSIAADSGPVGSDIDLGQNWRVWDGETWSEDRNIVVEIVVGDPAPVGLKPGGLCVAAATPSVASRRAKSQEPSSRRDAREPRSAR